MHDDIDRTRHPDVIGDVEFCERKALVAEKLLKIGFRTGYEVVQGDDLVTPIQERSNKIGAEEAGTSGYYDTGHRISDRCRSR